MSGIESSLIAAILYSAAREIGAKFNDPCANAIDDTIKYFEKEKRVVIIREHLAAMLEEGIGRAEINELRVGEKFIDVERLAKEFAIFSDLYLEDESEILGVCNELFSYFSNSLTRELLKDPESWKQTLLNMQSISLNISQEEHKEILEEIKKRSLQEQPPKQFPFEPSLHNQTPPEENFVGRKDMLKTITQWYKNPDVRIGALIGWGGVGKSALVRKWYEELEANKIQPDEVFWWGFYRNAHLELFLNALLRYVSGGQIEPDTIKGTWEKTDRIKEYLGQRSVPNHIRWS